MVRSTQVGKLEAHWDGRENITERCIVRLLKFSKHIALRASSLKPRTTTIPMLLESLHFADKLSFWEVYESANRTLFDTRNAQNFVISLSKIRDRDWSYTRHVIPQAAR